MTRAPVDAAASGRGLVRVGHGAPPRSRTMRAPRRRDAAVVSLGRPAARRRAVPAGHARVPARPSRPWRRCSTTRARQPGGASPATRTALLYVTAAAYGAVQPRASSRARAAASHFPYTAPAVVPAEVAIEFGLRGPYGAFSSAVRPPRSGRSGTRRPCSSPARATARSCWRSRPSRSARTSTPARGRSHRAAPGRGRRLPLARARAGRARSRARRPPRRRRRRPRAAARRDLRRARRSPRCDAGGRARREAHWSWPPAGAVDPPGWPGPEQ